MATGFEGKIAVVTGGASGIGRALCQQLVAAGARVVVADIAGPAAEATASALGENASAASVDVTVAAAVERLVSETVESHERIDYFFNNAGVAAVGEVADMSAEDFHWMLDVNVRGVIHGVLAAYPVMIRQGHGHIINTASLAGLTSTPMMAGYSASKHAVVGLSRGLQVEAKSYGILVSVVCPGIIQTPMIAANRIVGLDREQLNENMPMTPYDVDQCAADVLRGVRRKQHLIIVTGVGKLAWWIFRYLPGLFEWGAQREYRKAQRAKLDGSSSTP